MADKIPPMIAGAFSDADKFFPTPAPAAPPTTTLTTRLRELMEEATPGPWQDNFAHWGKSDITHPCSAEAHDGGLFINGKPHLVVTPTGLSMADAKLIVYLRNNAPTIIRLLEAGDGVEKALEVPEVWSEAERDGLVAAYSKASAKHGHTESLFAVAAWLLRHRLATLRAAREVKP